MVAYKDILNTFGGDTSYADRFQSAALRGDSAAMQSISREYRNSQSQAGQSQTYQTPTTSSTDYTEGYNQGNSNLGNWNYGADTADRQEEIVSNLNEAYQQDPSQFSDWATFANNFNYDYSGRSDKERETMRNWYSQMQQNNIDYNDANNADYFFNQLMGGNQISGEGAALTAAQNRYRNYQYLSGMAPDQIASAVLGGSISGVGQEMQDLKNNSPALYAQVQSVLQNNTAINDINTLGQGIYNGLTSTETNKNYLNYNMAGEFAQNASIIQQYNSSLYNKILGLGGDTAAYVAIVASMLQNPVIQNSKNEVEDLEGEIRTIQEQIYTIGDTSRTVLGSEAPEDLVSAYISQQTKQLQNKLRTAQNSLLVAQGKLDNQLSEVDIMIDALNNGIELSQTNAALAGTGTTGGTTSSSTTNVYYGGVQTAPTYNYQDDSAERLKEIANNLENYSKTNPELFNNRSTFNDYFKYNQRSTKQKQILDAYWAKYGNRFSIGGTNGGGTTETEDIPRQRLKAGIIDGTVGGSYGKTDMKQFGFNVGLNEEEVATKMAQICTVSEYKSIYNNLGESARKKFKNDIKVRIQSVVKKNASKIKTRLDDVKKKERDAEAERLAKELGINFDTLGKSAILSYYNNL